MASSFLWPAINSAFGQALGGVSKGAQDWLSSLSQVEQLRMMQGLEKLREQQIRLLGVREERETAKEAREGIKPIGLGYDPASGTMYWMEPTVRGFVPRVAQVGTPMTTHQAHGGRWWGLTPGRPPVPGEPIPDPVAQRERQRKQETEAARFALSEYAEAVAGTNLPAHEKQSLVARRAQSLGLSHEASVGMFPPPSTAGGGFHRIPTEPGQPQMRWDSAQGKVVSIPGAPPTPTRGTESGTPFAKWSPEEKRFWFEQTAAGANPPRFAWGDRKSFTEFNKEYAAWQTARGVTGGAAVAEGAEKGALTTALRENTRRETLVRGFTTRIDANAEILRQYQRRYGRNEFGRLLNAAQNNILRGVAGSGELAALQLALFSLSSEVAKVESGAFGIAGVSVNARKIVDKIHDWNMNVDDLEVVLRASSQLGKTSTEAFEKITRNLKERLRALGTLGGPMPPGGLQGGPARPLGPNERWVNGQLWRKNPDGTYQRVP